MCNCAKAQVNSEKKYKYSQRMKIQFNREKMFVGFEQVSREGREEKKEGLEKCNVLERTTIRFEGALFSVSPSGILSFFLSDQVYLSLTFL